jgi:CBS domain-containing protein
MLRSVDLSDHMQKNPAVVYADAGLFDAIRMITSHRLSGVCVVDHENNLVGVLSEIDCLRAIVGATYNDDNDVGTVGEHMTADVKCAQLHDNIVEVAKDMLQCGHRRRPVVKDGKLVGQITCRRLLSAVGGFNHPSS